MLGFFGAVVTGNRQIASHHHAPFARGANDTVCGQVIYTDDCRRRMRQGEQGVSGSIPTCTRQITFGNQRRIECNAVFLQALAVARKTVALESEFCGSAHICDVGMPALDEMFNQDTKAGARINFNKGILRLAPRAPVNNKREMVFCQILDAPIIETHAAQDDAIHEAARDPTGIHLVFFYRVGRGC